jgi:hypothetical protein
MRKTPRHPRRTLPLVARLNRIAEREQMTNAQIAVFVGCDVSCVSRWRAKNRQPRHGLLRAALVAFLVKHEPKKASAAK